MSDSCFSGDLARVVLPPKRRIKAIPMPADIAWRMRTAETRGVKLTGFEHAVKNLNGVLVSGCSARETSADAEIDGRPNGALTYYFLETLSGPNGLRQTLEQAVARTRSALQRIWIPAAPATGRFLGPLGAALPYCFAEKGRSDCRCLSTSPNLLSPAPRPGFLLVAAKPLECGL